MTPSTHHDYLVHLATQLDRHPHLRPLLRRYILPLVFLVSRSLDTVRNSLAALYCPTGQGDPYDPCAMLRSWLLMTLERVKSPDAWARRLRREPLLAILAGFVPGHSPCATAHRDFLARYADGPYEHRKQQHPTLSQSLKGHHERRLEDTTEARKKEAHPYHTQSEAIVTKLLNHADKPRDPNALPTRLEDLFGELGLNPTLAAGLLDNPKELTVSGDGTILASAASGDGQKTCDCPNSTNCNHPRLYTSATAQFCKDPHHDTYIFGDRSYTISTHVNSHDLPLITIMGTGNESDFTLAPKALDDLLKLIREHDLPMAIAIFVGDGHHDALAIYLYLHEKSIIPIIPLDSDSAPKTATPTTTPTQTPPESSAETPQETPSETPTEKPKTIRPHLARYPDIPFDPDGTPLCPAGCRMRHYHFVNSKRAHYFICPAQHGTRHGYRFAPDECPFHQDCRPDKLLGYTLYIASTANPRLFPPIPRASHRFKELYHERSSTERSNSVEDSYQLDRAHRNALYGLIRLTFVNICKHARVRWLEDRKTHSEEELFRQALARIGRTHEMTEMPN
jgi:hypothetical protein